MRAEEDDLIWMKVFDNFCAISSKSDSVIFCSFAFICEHLAKEFESTAQTIYVWVEPSSIS